MPGSAGDAAPGAEPKKRARADTGAALQPLPRVPAWVSFFSFLMRARAPSHSSVSLECLGQESYDESESEDLDIVPAAPDGEVSWERRILQQAYHVSDPKL